MPSFGPPNLVNRHKQTEIPSFYNIGITRKSTGFTTFTMERDSTDLEKKTNTKSAQYPQTEFEYSLLGRLSVSFPQYQQVSWMMHQVLVVLTRVSAAPPHPPSL